MSLVLTSGPALEPVTVSEAKAHLRLDGTAEDQLIASLILTSRLHVEAALGLALITQSWKLTLDRWPAGPAVTLPLRPVQTITAVRVLAADNTATTLAADDYVLDGARLPPRIVRAAALWPEPGKAASGIEIEFTAGFGAAAADVPQPVRQALLLLVAHWYEHREATEPGATSAAVPPSVSELLMPYRTPRL